MKKIQIREINDIHGNNYKIYDLMRRNKWGDWECCKCTYFTLEDAVRNHPGVRIEDITMDNIFKPSEKNTVKIKEKPIPEKDVVKVSIKTTMNITKDIARDFIDALKDSLK